MHPGVWDPLLPVDVDFLLQVGFILVIDELHNGLPADKQTEFRNQRGNWYEPTAQNCYSNCSNYTTATEELQTFYTVSSQRLHALQNKHPVIIYLYLGHPVMLSMSSISANPKTKMNIFKFVFCFSIVVSFFKQILTERVTRNMKFHTTRVCNAIIIKRSYFDQTTTLLRAPGRNSTHQFSLLM